MNAATLTAWMMKHPNQAVRYVDRWVRVEIVRAEEKVTAEEVDEFVADPERTAKMGFPCEKRVVVGTREVREAGFVIREKGRTKWVAADRIRDQKPVA